MNHSVRFMLLGAACAFLVGGAMTRSKAADKQPDPVLGTWTLNTDKSKFTPGPAPKSLSRTYTEGDDGVTLSIDTVAADGSASRGETTYRYDGKDYPVKGMKNFDSLAIKRVNPSVAKSVLKKSGKIIGHSTRTVSGGGHTLTLTGTEKDDKGATVSYTQVYDKS